MLSAEVLRALGSVSPGGRPSPCRLHRTATAIWLEETRAWGVQEQPGWDRSTLTFIPRTLESTKAMDMEVWQQVVSTATLCYFTLPRRRSELSGEERDWVQSLVYFCIFLLIQFYVLVGDDIASYSHCLSFTIIINKGQSNFGKSRHCPAHNVVQKKSCRYLLPFEHNVRTWQTDMQNTKHLTVLLLFCRRHVHLCSILEILAMEKFAIAHYDPSVTFHGHRWPLDSSEMRKHNSFTFNSYDLHCILLWLYCGIAQ